MMRDWDGDDEIDDFGDEEGDEDYFFVINSDEEIDEDRTSSLTSKTRINKLSAQIVWSVVESFPGS